MKDETIVEPYKAPVPVFNDLTSEQAHKAARLADDSEDIAVTLHQFPEGVFSMVMRHTSEPPIIHHDDIKQYIP